jgi:predicted ATP-binding protein involved in virulence
MNIATLRIDRLSLRNFRCFPECSVSLHETLTVFVAENGCGKTAILDAIGIALGSYVDGLCGWNWFHRIDRRDVRQVVSGLDQQVRPELPTAVAAEGVLNRQPVRWERTLHRFSRRARTSKTGVGDLLALIEKIRPCLDPSLENIANPLTLPLVAFYGTGRLWSEHKLTEGKKSLALDSRSRLSGYMDCLSSSSSFKGVEAWFRSKMAEIGDPKFSTDLAANLPLITAIQEAVRRVLEPTGWQDLEWGNEEQSFMVRHPDYGRLPLAALSDGVRNMIALVADIAHRCARLNPHLREDAARQTPGVVLIDEIDMHLHPRWQQLVVSLMQQAFPQVQFIVSTHSPHVLSTVDKESIRVIRFIDREPVIETPLFQTKGVLSADVLASIMGVDPIPQIPEAQWVSQYRALIEDGKAGEPEAQQLRQNLLAHFGEAHPLMIDCDRLIRFQDFRIRRQRQEDAE